MLSEINSAVCYFHQIESFRSLSLLPQTTVSMTRTRLIGTTALMTGQCVVRRPAWRPAVLASFFWVADVFAEGKSWRVQWSTGGFFNERLRNILEARVQSHHSCAELIEPVLTLWIFQGVASIKDTTCFDFGLRTVWPIKSSESQVFHQFEYLWCMQILVFGPKKHRRGGRMVGLIIPICGYASSNFVKENRGYPNWWLRFYSPLKMPMIGWPSFLESPPLFTLKYV